MESNKFEKTREKHKTITSPLQENDIEETHTIVEQPVNKPQPMEKLEAIPLHKNDMEKLVHMESPLI